jgi:hypothetical protein
MRWHSAVIIQRTFARAGPHNDRYRFDEQEFVDRGMKLDGKIHE